MPESPSAEHLRTSGMRFLTLSFAAILAGAVAGLAVVELGSYYTYPPELAERMLSPTADLTEHITEIDQMDRTFLIKNTALCGAVSGMLLAGLLGLSAGLFRSIQLAVAGLGVGLVLGGLFGALGGYGGAATWQHLVDEDYFANPTSDRTMHSATANTVVWAVVGLAAGAAAGFGGPLRKLMGGALAGLCGGALAAWLFLFLASVAFPAARLGLPMPENLAGAWEGVVARIFWAALPAILIGLFAAVATAPDRPPAPQAEASSPQA